MNSVELVGKLVEKSTITGENERKLTTMTLAIQRSWKNINGTYETDLIPCIVWNDVSSNACDFIRKGDIVGVKGRLQINNNKIEVIAEKITFLSSKKASDE